MPPVIPNPADPVPGETLPAAGQPGSGIDLSKPLEEQVAEWQRRFGGLSSRFNQEHSALLTANAKAMDVEALLQAAIGEKEALGLTNDKLETDLAAALAKQKEVEAAQARTNLIALEFPGLLKLEKDGLLPAGSGEELKTKLAALSAHMGSAAQTAAQTAAAAAQAAALPLGATPPVPAGVAPTRAGLMQQLIAARGTPDYDRIQKELVKFEPPDPALALSEPARSPAA